VAVISLCNRVLNGALLLACATLPAQIDATPGAAAPSLTAERIENFDSRKTSILLSNGQTIAYIDSGPKQAPTVVLIHGYTDSARDWLPVEPLLEKRFRLIIVDLRGHGASGKPECCYTRFDFAYDIELLLRSLHIRTADVVGHSLGSIVAQTVAELWPGRTRRLILISSTGTSFGTQGWLTDVQRLDDPIDPDSRFMRNWWNQSIAINPEAFSSRQRRDAAAIPARLWRAIADQSLVGVDLRTMLPRVRAPTLLIWGARDTLVTEEGREVLRTGIAGSRVRIFDSLGHDLFWEDPCGVTSAITDFLADFLAAR
jgi:pimeloyl-ACP methyl ester carboxylesterase